MKPQIGGSFAPPLNDTKLKAYKKIIDSLSQSPIRDAMVVCYNCCVQWWDLPESSAKGQAHPSGVGVVIPLDSKIAKALDEHIPWDDEIAMMMKVFDRINPASKELRDAAHHLLWHVVELSRGREPITTDKL